MNWETIVPTIETIRKQHLNRLEKNGPAALAACDQDLMFFRNILSNIGISPDDITERDLYMILMTTVLNWWIAVRSQDNGTMSEGEYASVVAASSSAAWGIISLVKPVWLKEGAPLP